MPLVGPHASVSAPMRTGWAATTPALSTIALRMTTAMARAKVIARPAAAPALKAAPGGPSRRASPGPRPYREGDRSPVPTDQEGGGDSDHTVELADLAVRIEDERERQTELLRVGPDRGDSLARVDRHHREALWPEFPVQTLDPRHLGATFETPGGPEVQQNDAPTEVGERDRLTLDGGPRNSAASSGRVAGELEGAGRGRGRRRAQGRAGRTSMPSTVRRVDERDAPSRSSRHLRGSSQLPGQLQNRLARKYISRGSPPLARTMPCLSMRKSHR